MEVAMLTKTIERLHVPGPKAQTVLARDKEVVAPAYGRVADLVMSHGLGSQVWDVDGNRYIDFVAGIAVNSTGHSHPAVVRAIQQQADKFLHISSDYYHEL
ncbi:MAG: aminotransferase class III-fold pyridoxal phosphate-dependent enzyme, partial [Caldilineaceae bacterium]|nr:aminotransferase class III-fold pyridoxal phosphate-dependent enzyme [Caldilineaceae bacterium]